MSYKIGLLSRTVLLRIDHSVKKELFYVNYPSLFLQPRVVNTETYFPIDLPIIKKELLNLWLLLFSFLKKKGKLLKKLSLTLIIYRLNPVSRTARIPPIIYKIIHDLLELCMVELTYASIPVGYNLFEKWFSITSSEL